MSEASAENKQFAIQKIYVKDLSFETPNSPAVFTEEWKPEVNLNLNSESRPVADNVYEVVMKLTVTAKQGEKTAYLAEVQQAGIFTIAGFAEDEVKPMLGAFCPNTLYPFAREAVADLVQRGGFPPLLLAPINFDALYAQQVNEVQAQVANPDNAQH
ncbi:protein-export chaperone SecB [Thiohalobacter thiocyanaticus]|uniref:Protein-export protein SecB n=1 Tax=Thiohalobacter thiocyanaticus TaxID=585455 RepID=A0A426QJG5_9GAMM|nr:protein-export chaperone SecB [Thiohalobacter thiocyanaticus]RRQ21903.1 protein-export chaperone SecB [Thiohalobacter thiocyanaticus]